MYTDNESYIVLVNISNWIQKEYRPHTIHLFHIYIYIYVYIYIIYKPIAYTDNEFYIVLVNISYRIQKGIWTAYYPYSW